MDAIINVLNLQELANEGGDTAIWGALVATLTARCGSNITINPHEMASALSKKELVLERVDIDGFTGLNIRLMDFKPSEMN